MSIRANDVVPFTDARDQLAELAEDVVLHGNEKVLTRGGVGYVALIDARKLDYYHALEAEYANLVLVGDALQGLADLAAGRVVEEHELDRALGIDSTTKPRKKD